MGGNYDFVDITEDVDFSDGDQFGAIDGYGKLPSLMIESDDEIIGLPEGGLQTTSSGNKLLCLENFEDPENKRNASSTEVNSDKVKFSGNIKTEPGIQQRKMDTVGHDNWENALRAFKTEPESSQMYNLESFAPKKSSPKKLKCDLELFTDALDNDTKKKPVSDKSLKMKAASCQRLVKVKSTGKSKVTKTGAEKYFEPKTTDNTDIPQANADSVISHKNIIKRKALAVKPPPKKLITPTTKFVGNAVESNSPPNITATSGNAKMDDFIANKRQPEGEGVLQRETETVIQQDPHAVTNGPTSTVSHVRRCIDSTTDFTKAFKHALSSGALNTTLYSCKSGLPVNSDHQYPRVPSKVDIKSRRIILPAPNFPKQNVSGESSVDANKLTPGKPKADFQFQQTTAQASQSYPNLPKNAAEKTFTPNIQSTKPPQTIRFMPAHPHNLPAHFPKPSHTGVAPTKTYRIIKIVNANQKPGANGQLQSQATVEPIKIQISKTGSSDTNSAITASNFSVQENGTGTNARVNTSYKVVKSFHKASGSMTLTTLTPPANINKAQYAARHSVTGQMGLTTSAVHTNIKMGTLVSRKSASGFMTPIRTYSKDSKLLARTIINGKTTSTTASALSPYPNMGQYVVMSSVAGEKTTTTSAISNNTNMGQYVVMSSVAGEKTTTTPAVSTNPKMGHYVAWNRVSGQMTSTTLAVPANIRMVQSSSNARIVNTNNIYAVPPTARNDTNGVRNNFANVSTLASTTGSSIKVIPTASLTNPETSVTIPTEQMKQTTRLCNPSVVNTNNISPKTGERPLSSDSTIALPYGQPTENISSKRKDQHMPKGDIGYEEIQQPDKNEPNISSKDELEPKKKKKPRPMVVKQYDVNGTLVRKISVQTDIKTLVIKSDRSKKNKKKNRDSVVEDIKNEVKPAEIPEVSRPSSDTKTVPKKTIKRRRTVWESSPSDNDLDESNDESSEYPVVYSRPGPKSTKTRYEKDNAYNPHAKWADNYIPPTIRLTRQQHALEESKDDGTKAKRAPMDLEEMENVVVCLRKLTAADLRKLNVRGFKFSPRKRVSIC